MSSVRFSARLDIYHGPPHPFKDAGVVADSLSHPQCDGEVPLRCPQELHTQEVLGVPTGKNPEDSNPASVEAM
jgi:hypothetical protein